jgi:DNA repair exonuclease SbcCD ATPase subunit
MRRNVSSKRVKWSDEERANVKLFLEYLDSILAANPAPTLSSTQVLSLINQESPMIEQDKNIGSVAAAAVVGATSGSNNWSGAGMGVENANEEIECIYHMADIHIRIYERHDEYQQVFNQLYEYLDRQTEERRRKSIILIAGDILHSKNNLSPPCVIFTSKFFKELTSRVKAVIIIPGNHDINMNNPGREDSLTSIIYDKENSYRNLYYWKESGIYQMNNLIFGYSSLVDSQFIHYDRVREYMDSIENINNKNWKTISIFHGGVSSPYITQDRPSYIVQDFAGYDYTLLGDIHNFCYLNDTETMAYPSSMIQQNYGESIDHHGFIEWNLKEGTSKYVELQNEYSYYTLHVYREYVYHVERNEWMAVDKVGDREVFEFSKKPRVRVFYHDSNIIHLSKLEQYMRIREDIQIIEFLTVYVSKREQFFRHCKEFNTIADVTTASAASIETNPTSLINTVSDMCSEMQGNMYDIVDADGGVSVDEEEEVVQVEEKVEDQIRTFLSEQILTEREWNKIYEIHGEIEKQWRAEHQGQGQEVKAGNQKFRIMRLEFSNMFRYGENNYIDFRKFTAMSAHQSIGIFGNNYIGKSSIFDIILYCLFEKFARGGTRDIINIEKDWFECKMVIKVENKYYLIDRRGERTKAGGMQTNVFFYEIMKNNELRIMNGVNKQETARIIEGYVGTYDDFVLISMMIQKEISVLDYTQSRKKEFFHHLFRLDRYQEYYEIAKMKSKESVEFEIKQLDKRIKEHNVANYDQNIAQLTNQIQLLENEYEIQQKQIELDELRMRELRDQLNPIDEIILPTGTTWDMIEEAIEKNRGEFANARNIPREEWYLEKVSQIQKLSETLQQLKQKKETLRKKITSIVEYMNVQTHRDLLGSIVAAIYNKSGSSSLESPASGSIDSIIAEWKVIYDGIEGMINRIRTMREMMEDECEEMQDESIMDEWRSIQNEIEKKMEHKNKKERKIRELKGETDRLEEKIEKAREMRDKLQKHRYNPQCEYCCENPFVKQAQRTIDEIPELEVKLQEIHITVEEQVRERDEVEESITKMRQRKQILDEMMTNNRAEIQKYKKKIQMLQQIVEFMKDWKKSYEELTPTKENIRTSLKNQEIEKEIEEWKQRRTRYNEYVRNTELFARYQQNKIMWRENDELHKEIDQIGGQVEGNKRENKKKYERLCKSRIEVERYETLRLEYIRDKKNYEDKKMEMEIYRLYLTCMEKNGIPMMLLRKSIPNMEQLMNDFLKGFVGFRLKIEIKDMDLEFRIIRKNSGDSAALAASPVEIRDYNILLLSGFERFITQVALRLAMHQLGMLPTCSTFFVDEGVNCFDRENLAKVSMLFEQILYRYETFIVITHLDQVKDSVQSFIEIGDTGKYSSVQVV